MKPLVKPMTQSFDKTACKWVNKMFIQLAGTFCIPQVTKRDTDIE